MAEDAEMGDRVTGLGSTESCEASVRLGSDKLARGLRSGVGHEVDMPT